MIKRTKFSLPSKVLVSKKEVMKSGTGVYAPLIQVKVYTRLFVRMLHLTFILHFMNSI
jgi:hypothetical protein